MHQKWWSSQGARALDSLTMAQMLLVLNHICLFIAPHRSNGRCGAGDAPLAAFSSGAEAATPVSVAVQVLNDYNGKPSHVRPSVTAHGRPSICQEMTVKNNELQEKLWAANRERMCPP